MLFDTHCHIYMNKNLSQNEIIDWFQQDQITKITSIWVDLKTSKTSIELAQQYPQMILATVWLHPSDTPKFWNVFEETLNELEELILQNREVIVWVGECGFDYHWIDKENFEASQALQERFFIAQIALSRKYDLPFIVHTRDAREDTLRVLKEQNYDRFILHCFSEDLEFASECIEHFPRCKVSFSWIVTYKNAPNIQNTAANIPLERIIIETDAPFLSPQAVRWTENIPNNIKYTLEKIISLRLGNGKDETPEIIKQQIYANSLEVFWVK